jgi:hypothetical protein
MSTQQKNDWVRKEIIRLAESSRLTYLPPMWGLTPWALFYWFWFRAEIGWQIRS